MDDFFNRTSFFNDAFFINNINYFKLISNLLNNDVENKYLDRLQRFIYSDFKFGNLSYILVASSLNGDLNILEKFNDELHNNDFELSILFSYIKNKSFSENQIIDIINKSCVIESKNPKEIIELKYFFKEIGPDICFKYIENNNIEINPSYLKLLNKDFAYNLRLNNDYTNII